MLAAHLPWRSPVTWPPERAGVDDALDPEDPPKPPELPVDADVTEPPRLEPEPPPDDEVTSPPIPLPIPVLELDILEAPLSPLPAHAMAGHHTRYSTLPSASLAHGTFARAGSH